MNILVVDDHQDMQDYLQDILSEQGYKVAKAGSADEALASLERDEFHLVIMDKSQGTGCICRTILCLLARLCSHWMCYQRFQF